MKPRVRPRPRQKASGQISITGERRHVQVNKSAAIKCEKSGPGHTGGCLCVLSGAGHMDCVILVQEWPHRAGCEVWECRRMETDGTGAGFFFWRENAFHCSDVIQSPLIFFFLCRVRSWGLSRFSVRRMVMTPGPGSGLSPGGRGHNEHQNPRPYVPMSLTSSSHHLSSHCVSYSGGHHQLDGFDLSFFLCDP